MLLLLAAAITNLAGGSSPPMYFFFFTNGLFQVLLLLEIPIDGFRRKRRHGVSVLSVLFQDFFARFYVISLTLMTFTTTFF